MPLADPERRLVLAYVPASVRAAVAALWVLDEAFARTVAAAREPAIGAIRLAWWREALDALDVRPAPGEPVLQALAAEVLPREVTGAELAAMEEGWAVLLPIDDVGEAEIADHAAERGERLFALTGRLLGGVPPTGAGGMWAQADLARTLIPSCKGRGTAGEAGGGGARLGAALAEAPLHQPSAGPPPRAEQDYKWPSHLRPLGMLAVLARRDPAERQGSPARILRMLRHRLTGR